MLRVRRGPFYVLLLLALALQCSPLCTCNLIEALSSHAASFWPGAHAAAAGHGTGILHTCESPSGEAECSGLCAISKSRDVKRSILPADIHFAPFSYILYTIPHRPALSSATHACQASSGDGPSPPLSIPLLI